MMTDEVNLLSISLLASVIWYLSVFTSSALAAESRAGEATGAGLNKLWITLNFELLWMVLSITWTHNNG